MRVVGGEKSYKISTNLSFFCTIWTDFVRSLVQKGHQKGYRVSFAE